MNAQEKATELFNNYSDLLSGCFSPNLSYNLKKQRKAQCALLAANAAQFAAPKKDFQYWEEVKTELRKKLI